VDRLWLKLYSSPVVAEIDLYAHDIITPHLHAPLFLRFRVLYSLLLRSSWSRLGSGIHTRTRNYTRITSRLLHKKMSMTELLSESLGDTRFSDANATGYQSRAPSRSPFEHSHYTNFRNTNLGTYSNPPPPQSQLCSPFDYNRDINTPRQEATYTQDALNASGFPPMRSQVSLL
jgi:hypothetical protein